MIMRRAKMKGRELDLSNGLFEAQRNLYYEKEKRVAADCGRRAGKTTTLARMVMDGAERNPQVGEDESITAYIAPTKNQAKRLIWGKMQILSQQNDIAMEFNNTDLIATHPNGAQVWLMGANDDRDVERLRGFAYRRVLIDEAQAVGADFADLIDEVIDPALADYDGQLVLSGTPNAACVGYFWEACTGQRPGWTNHHWNITDNEMFPKWRSADNWREIASKWLEDKRIGQEWGLDHPTYQREWLGHWVRDVGGLVYRCEDWNTYGGEIPDGYNWMHVMGVDFGHDDAFACTVWAFTEDLPTLYERETVKYTGKTVTDWANTMKIMTQEYAPVKTVADTGALGKAIAKEITQRHGIPMDPAKKADKQGNIALMNAGYAKREVFLVRGGPLHKEQRILQWDDRITTRRIEDGRFSNDACDAALYGFVAAKHYLFEDKGYGLPPRGTPARVNLEMDEFWEKEAEAMKVEGEVDWWEVW